MKRRARAAYGDAAHDGAMGVARFDIFARADCGAFAMGYARSEYDAAAEAAWARGSCRHSMLARPRRRFMRAEQKLAAKPRFQSSSRRCDCRAIA